MEAIERWRTELAAWRIPEHILAAAEDSPWVLPRPVFTRRADRQLRSPEGASHPAAWDALDPPGSLLDIGAGAGSACLPLAPRCTGLTAVDEDAELLAELDRRAGTHGLSARLVRGSWPAVATEVAPADVVLCHHVLYNVAELEPFVTALTGHARRLVVVELADRHPLTALNPLWRHFHDIDRPEGPSARDAVAALAELGIHPGVRRWRRTPAAEHPDPEALVEATRRRLCLPRSRTAEVAAVLRERGELDAARDLGASGSEIVTLTWRGTA
ncbi:class I SAM-dependent methyltransferase [Amycolatopsis aidingensis]|uniref:class I SAM-dependent methyltransferase n=1 Tax=Amycolatopsis aidingensis TaxID=2842453 RepID=UPI001C0CCBF1|nr:class I SAM-dependent methyltransferase [Amycolatopsis aidingensis]